MEQAANTPENDSYVFRPLVVTPKGVMKVCVEGMTASIRARLRVSVDGASVVSGGGGKGVCEACVC